MIRATRRFLIPAPIGVLFLIASAVQAAQVEVGFSPEGSAETLVVNVIQKAEHQVLLMDGYGMFRRREPAKPGEAPAARG